MKHNIVISFLAVLFVTVSTAYAGESVSFNGTDKAGEPLVLKGILNKPQGKGPFPAIVMLSGGKGWNEAWDNWIERFVKWGYVTLQVQTLASRGLSDIFEGGGGVGTGVSPRVAAQDAHDAKTYVSSLQYVDGKRVALIGWYFGGWAVPYAIDPSAPIRNRSTPFTAAIAFDPLCDQPLMGFDAPLLILHGELDDWHSVSRCRIIEGRCEHEIILKIYPGAYMCFDLEGVDGEIQGHRMLYNPTAAADAVEKVKRFLAKHEK